MANYHLRANASSGAKQTVCIAIVRNIQREAAGTRKYSYFAYLTFPGQSMGLFANQSSKILRIFANESEKPTFAKGFIYSPQRFLMLRFRLDKSKRAGAINFHEDYPGQMPHAVFRAIFMAVCRDMKGNGAQSINTDKIRQGNHTDVPFSRLLPIIDAHLHSDGFGLAPLRSRQLKRLLQ